MIFKKRRGEFEELMDFLPFFMLFIFFVAGLNHFNVWGKLSFFLDLKNLAITYLICQIIVVAIIIIKLLR